MIVHSGVTSAEPTREFDINDEFDRFMHGIGLSAEETGGQITFLGFDPIFQSRHKIAACISIPIMAAAAGAATVWRMRTGRGQDLSLDLRKAIHGVNPMYKFSPTVNGYAYQWPWMWGNPMVFDLYMTKDGRWVLPTGGYPHMAVEWTTLLRCGVDKRSIANAVLQWDGQDLDDAAAERNMIFAMCRSRGEWLQHPVGQLLASKPLVEIEKIGDSEPEPF